MENLTIDEVISLYIDAADKQYGAIQVGNTRAADKVGGVIATAYRELRQRGVQAQTALLPLLEHPDPSVRIWAASHTLEFEPEQAEPVLEKLAGEDSLQGFSGDMTLRVWKDGSLRFP